MKKVLFAALCTIYGTANAVSLYADTAGTTLASIPKCGMYLDAQPKVEAPTVLVGTVVTCKFDLSGISNGSHTVKVTAISVDDPVWGAQESAPSAPFVFTKTAAPSAPTTIRIAP